MARDIALPELERLIADGAQLVEVLPEPDYVKAHLPGAINIPLRQLTAESAERLDRDRPVVVYCFDSL
jgi:rhodanese-related sulfurtransferase